uniref:Uncharacterized protein n=1 Tax=Dulem virus 42 TaxID=3145760 RepID=A0AAU8B8K2_9CAUD
METTRIISIGNDVRINFTLDKLTDENFTNIKQIHCYLVNINPSMPEKPKKKNFFDLYCKSTEYTIRKYGIPAYNVVPDYSHTCGFSVGKHKKHNKDKHADCEVEEIIYKVYGHTNVYTAYNHQIDVTKGVSAYYPACEQRKYGDYKLVVAVTVQEHGWGSCGVHHYMIDYGVLFSIVKEGGEDGSIIIDITNVEPNVPPIVEEPAYAYFGFNSERYAYQTITEEDIENGEALTIPVVNVVKEITNHDKLRCVWLGVPNDKTYTTTMVDSDGDDTTDGIVQVGKYDLYYCSPGSYYSNTITINVK